MLDGERRFSGVRIDGIRTTFGRIERALSSLGGGGRSAHLESAICERAPTGGVDTLLPALYSHDSQTLDMSQIKIQVGQLWKKDATGDIYLVTRLYSEALNTMAVLRKSGAEGEAQVRVRVERGSKGQTMQGFSPAQEEESY